MNKLAALRKLAYGVPAEPPLENVAEQPIASSQKTPKMTREEWLRMGQENGWGMSSTNNTPVVKSPAPDSGKMIPVPPSGKVPTNSPQRTPRDEFYGSAHKYDALNKYLEHFGRGSSGGNFRNQMPEREYPRPKGEFLLDWISIPGSRYKPKPQRYYHLDAAF